MNIGIVAKKGGVGKSTLSILLCEALKQAGKSVDIRDWDAQGTSTKAMQMIGHEREPKPEIVIFDTPPNLEHNATATAARSADVLLVITSPSPADVWEAEDAVTFAKSRNKNCQVRVVFNKVRPRTILGRLMDQSAKQLSAESLPCSITQRECYQHAIGQGWKALDAPAREEVLSLAVSILSIK